MILIAEIIGAKGVRIEKNVRELIGLDSWMTLCAIVEETGPGNIGGGSGGGKKVGGGEWACRHCTYVNCDSEICEMCGLPNE